MTHQSNKHFNTYKEGLDLEVLRQYCMEHGEKRTFLRGETLEDVGEPAQWVAFVERGCFKYMVHNDEKGKDYCTGFAFEGEFAGYFTAMLLSYFVGQKRNPIDYELKSIFTYTALFAVVYGISLINPIENSIAKMAINTVLLVVFVAYFIKKDLPLKSLPVIGKFFR